MVKIEQWMEGHKITSFFLNRDHFALIYTTICILWFFPLLGWLINPLCKVCFIWGAFLILWDFLTKRQMFRSAYWVFPLLILFSFGITILFNIKYSFYMGIKHAVYLGISLLLLYGQDRKKSFDSLKTLLYRLNTIIISITLVAAAISLFMFIFQISFSFYSGDVLLRQGFLENRLFGVYTSPNTGALFVMISIAAMLINSMIKNNGAIRPNRFYITNFVFQTIYFSLTLSNGGFLTLIAFFLLFCVVYAFPRFQGKLGNLKAVLASFLVAVILVAGTYAVTQSVRYGMSYLPSMVKSIRESVSSPGSSEENPSKKDDEITKIEMERIESGDDLSNGRFTIWVGSLKALRQHPLFGYANMWVAEGDALRFDTSSFSQEETTWLYKHMGNLHNAYIQIVVYSGVVGLLLFGLFGLLLVKKVGLVLIYGKKNTAHYNILALLFAVIGAILANGMVEAHLLYTRQDPYGAIFWLYVGITVVLSELYQRNGETADGKNCGTFALAADTPFQTMNCINFVLHNTDGSADNADLYIYHQFRNSHEIAERIRQSGIFHNVYDIEPYKTYSPLVQKFVTIYRMFLPQNTIQASCKQKLRLWRKGYKTLCISFPTPFTLGLHMAFPNAQVYHIEDGLGSYSGNLNADYASGLFRFIDRFMYDGNLELHPTACYLSAPAFSKSTMEGEVRQLPHLTPGSDLETMQQIFSYRANRLYRDRAVYLTQPLEERNTYRPEQEKRLFALVREKLSDRALVRIHPRQAEADFAGMEKDAYCNLWELECIDQIDDRNILISAFSTTQFMPKILKDVEPTVLFTYRLLLSDLDDPFLKDFANLIDDFRGLYRNPEKIYVPATFEELETILDTLSALS